MILPKDPKDGVEGEKVDAEVVANPEAKSQAQYAETPVIVAETKYATLLESGKFSKREVLDGIRILLESELADETDRPLINAAIEFIENPINDFNAIKPHTKIIAMVSAMSYYDGVPASITALAAYFYSLQCINRMNFVESELAKGVTDSREIEDAITQALADAELLAGENFKDPTLLEAATALHDRLPEAVRNSMADRKLANETIRKVPFSKDPAEAN